MQINHSSSNYAVLTFISPADCFTKGEIFSQTVVIIIDWRMPIIEGGLFAAQLVMNSEE
jgi:FixJ family two-component response regulator